VNLTSGVRLPVEGGGQWDVFASSPQHTGLFKVHPASDAISTGVKRSGREAGHLPPSSVEVKYAGSYTPLPHGMAFN